MTRESTTQQPTHPTDELLPAYVAGSLDPAAARAVEEHVAGCAACSAARREWELVHAASHAAAGATPAPSRGTLDRAFAKIEGGERQPGWRERWLSRSLRSDLVRRSLQGVTAAAVLAVAVGFTPIGSYAQGLLDLMRPQQFTVVPVTIEDLQSLPSLDLYGEFSFVPDHDVASMEDSADAGAATGMTVLTPSDLPATVTSPPAYVTIPSQSATFTFDAARASASAAANGESLPPMPANIDGSSLEVTTGDAVVAVYGGPAGMLGLAGETAQPPSIEPLGDQPLGNEAAGTEVSRIPDISSMVPELVVGQMVAPVATSSGASAEELRDYLLSQPGISDNLANALRAITDPATMWPIPVPAGEVDTRSITVQGVRGTVFSDRSGFFAGVVWLKDGIIYAVAAPLGEDEVLRVADSLR